MNNDKDAYKSCVEKHMCDNREYTYVFNWTLVIFKKEHEDFESHIKYWDLKKYMSLLAYQRDYTKQEQRVLKNIIRKKFYGWNQCFHPQTLAKRIKYFGEVTDLLIECIYRVMSFVLDLLTRDTSYSKIVDTDRMTQIRVILSIMNLYRKNMIHKILDTGNKCFLTKIEVDKKHNCYLFYIRYGKYMRFNMTPKFIDKQYIKSAINAPRNTKLKKNIFMECFNQQGISDDKIPLLSEDLINHDMEEENTRQLKNLHFFIFLQLKHKWVERAKKLDSADETPCCRIC